MDLLIKWFFLISLHENTKKKNLLVCGTWIELLFFVPLPAHTRTFDNDGQNLNS